MHNLYLTAGAYGGTSIKHCIIEACAAATRLQLDIHVRLNDVTVIATPNADPDGLYELYTAEADGPRSYKVVCWHAEKRQLNDLTWPAPIHTKTI